MIIIKNKKNAVQGNRFKVLIIAALLAGGFLLPGPALAAAEKPEVKLDFTPPVLQVAIPGVPDFTAPVPKACQQTALQGQDSQCVRVPWVAQYLNAIYKYGVALAAMMAVAMIGIGGLMYIFSGASQSKVSQAKDYIMHSVFGVVLLLISAMILYYINPRLLQFPVFEIEVVKKSDILYMDDVFCADLDKKDFEVPGFVPDVAPCGQKFEIKVLTKSGTTRTTTSNLCVASYCYGSKICVQKKIDNYVCLEVPFWGRIADGGERYVDNVWVVAVDDDGDTSRISGAMREVGQGKKSYYIPKTDEIVEDIREADYIVLEVELNDTDLGGIDDNYYVGYSTKPQFVKGQRAYQGIHIFPCEDEFFVQRPCSDSECKEVALGQDDWQISLSPVPSPDIALMFTPGDFFQSDGSFKGIQLDIDARYFQPDLVLMCINDKPVTNFSYP